MSNLILITVHAVTEADGTISGRPGLQAMQHVLGVGGDQLQAGSTA
jgi:hypothetical protein